MVLALLVILFEVPMPWRFSKEDGSLTRETADRKQIKKRGDNIKLMNILLHDH